MMPFLWSLLQVVVFVFVVGLLAWLANKAIDEFGGSLPAMVVKVLRFLIIVVVVIALIVLLLSLTGYMPGPILRPL